jgi:hypothetical protein
MFAKIKSFYLNWIFFTENLSFTKTDFTTSLDYVYLGPFFLGLG